MSLKKSVQNSVSSLNLDDLGNKIQQIASFRFRNRFNKSSDSDFLSVTKENDFVSNGDENLLELSSETNFLYAKNENKFNHDSGLNSGEESSSPENSVRSRFPPPIQTNRRKCPSQGSESGLSADDSTSDSINGEEDADSFVILNSGSEDPAELSGEYKVDSSDKLPLSSQRNGQQSAEDSGTLCLGKQKDVQLSSDSEVDFLNFSGKRPLNGQIKFTFSTDSEADFPEKLCRSGSEKVGKKCLPPDDIGERRNIISDTFSSFEFDFNPEELKDVQLEKVEPNGAFWRKSTKGSLIKVDDNEGIKEESERIDDCKGNQKELKEANKSFKEESEKANKRNQEESDNVQDKEIKEEELSLGNCACILSGVGNDGQNWGSSSNIRTDFFRENTKGSSKRETDAHSTLSNVQSRIFSGIKGQKRIREEEKESAEAEYRTTSSSSSSSDPTRDGLGSGTHQFSGSTKQEKQTSQQDKQHQEKTTNQRIHKTTITGRVCSDQEQKIHKTTITGRVCSDQEQEIHKTTSKGRVCSDQEQEIHKTTSKGRVCSDQEQKIHKTPITGRVCSDQEQEIHKTTSKGRVCSDQEQEIHKTTNSNSATSVGASSSCKDGCNYAADYHGRIGNLTAIQKRNQTNGDNQNKSTKLEINGDSASNNHQNSISFSNFSSKLTNAHRNFSSDRLKSLKLRQRIRKRFPIRNLRPKVPKCIGGRLATLGNPLGSIALNTFKSANTTEELLASNNKKNKVTFTTSKLKNKMAATPLAKIRRRDWYSSCFCFVSIDLLFTYF